MNTKRCCVLVILIIVSLVLTLSLSFAQAKTEIKIQPKIPVTPRVTPSPDFQVPDNPRIQEFIATPSVSTQGCSVTFRWRVEPGPGGSPVNSVRLTLETREIHSSSSPSGEYRFHLHSSIIPDENRTYQFVLTATNQINRSSTRTARLQVLGIDYVLRGLSIRLEANPQEFRSRQPIEFKISFWIPSSGTIGDPIIRTPIEIPVDGIVLKQGARIAGRATGLRLPTGGYGPPVSREGTYTIQDNGFTGSEEPYVVEIDVRGRRKQQTFRVRPLLFEIY